MELFTQEQIKYLESMFVQRDSCSNRHEKLDTKIDDIKLTQERITTKLDISSKIEWVILAACLTAVVAAVMNLILK